MSGLPPHPGQHAPPKPPLSLEDKNKRIATIGVVVSGLIVLGILAILALPNLYFLGGIEFPSRNFARAYLAIWAIAIYGGALIMPLVAMRLVRKHSLKLFPAVAVVSVPLMLQAIAFVLFIILGNHFGLTP